MGHGIVPYATNNISSTEIAIIEKAFDFFNHHLFNGNLTPCIFTLQRQSHCYGSFSAKRFESRSDSKDKRHEIAVNPGNFDRSDIEIWATFVHEMVHLWQREHGKPSRNGYHNKEWAEKMELIGLEPIGEKKGKKTGQKMHHIIDSGGPFEEKASQFIQDNLQLTWKSIEIEKPKKANQKHGKCKFVCQGCGQIARAKITANLICGACNLSMSMEV